MSIKTSNKIVFLTVLLTLSMASAMFYSFYIGRDIAERYAPLINASMEIKVQTTTGHLWLEEAISGDSSIDINKVWQHIDEAEWYAKTMLSGGKNKKGLFISLSDPELRHQIEQTIDGIKVFRILAHERWDSRIESGIGSAIDQRFDKNFLEFTLAADHVQASLQKVMQQQIQHFSLVQNLLIVMIVIFGSLIAFVLYRYDTKRETDIRTLFDKEENLRITLNSIGDAVIVTDSQGNVTHLNPVAEELTGWSLAEALETPLTEVFDIVHAQSLERADNPVERVITTGKIVGLANHTMLISKKGPKYQIADSGAPIRSSSGEITGVVVVFRDVTEEYALQESLESSRTFLSTLLHTLPDLIWLKDSDGTYLVCNGRFEQLFGAKESEIVGKTDYDFVDKELADLCRKKDKLVLALGQSSVNEERLSFANDGHVELVETIKTPMHDSKGKFIGILGISRDITQRKEDSTALEQFKTMFEESPFGVALIDSLTGKIHQVNPKFSEIAGRTHEEMLTIDWMSITHPDDVQEDLDNMARLNSGEISGFNMQKRYQHPNGAYVWITMTIAPVTVEDKTQPRHLCMIQDITQQKRLEEESYASMQHLQLYREQTPLAAIEWNTDFQVLDWNQAAEKMFGYTLDEVKGRDFVDIMLPENAVVDVEGVWQGLIAQTGGTTSINENMTKDGKIILCEWHNTPLVNDSGKVIGAASLVLDVTGERAALQALKQKEQEQSDILNTLTNGVITIDEDGTILSFNLAAENLFGYPYREALGQNISILMPERNKSKHDSYLTSYLASDNTRTLSKPREVDGQHKDKRTFPLRISLAELPLATNGKRRFIGSCQDLTQIKSQQAQLQRAQKMDALGKIVGGIAHDYNNMLGVILGYTDLIDLKYSDNVDGLKKYIDNIAQAGERGRKLTKRMLNFSKQESSHAQAIELHEILDEQKELLQKSVTARIQINYQLCESPWRIWIDASELEDTLLNLTINAQHAMPEGGTLTFTTQTTHLSHSEALLLGLSENDYVKLSVTDTGCGIDAEIISKIFDPFFSTKGGNGTGLGLSQVYGFMERTGGIVRVYSQKDAGSEFILYFPRYIGSEVQSVKEQAGKLLKQGNGETILVVDDEPALRELAQEILSMAGYRILLANDGDNAMDVLAANAIDCVLSDVVMPNIDGYQLARHIKEKYPNIKIQLASGFSDNRHISSPDKSLHSSLLHKPYSSSELITRIAELLHGDSND